MYLPLRIDMKVRRHIHSPKPWVKVFSVLRNKITANEWYIIWYLSLCIAATVGATIKRASARMLTQ